MAGGGSPLEKRKSKEQGVLVLTTVAKQSQARKLARVLVEERLCGCVSIVPDLESLYRWNDRIERSSELLLLLKTTRRKLRSLERRLGELHPLRFPRFSQSSPPRSRPPMRAGFRPASGERGPVTERRE
jgi:periplasmic divalent cation tolerance protein